MIITKHKSRPKLKILVVDDDSTTLELSVATLKRMGHNVSQVENGEDALAAATNQRFDIIFMDIEMPGMDGFQTTEKIRALDAGSFTAYIVALSGHIESTDTIHHCIKCGMNDCVAKPLKEELLKQRMDLWIHLNRVMA